MTTKFFCIYNQEYACAWCLALRRASAYVRIAHADRRSGAGVTIWSVGLRLNRTMKASIAYYWLVKTLHNVLSSFTISLVLFCPLGFFCTLTLLLSLSQCCQPSAVFSTRLRKTRMLRRTSRADLPDLHCQETPFFPACPRPPNEHRQCTCMMHEFLKRACECK